MKVYHHATFAKAYQAMLRDLIKEPEFTTRPRDLVINENINTILEIEDPSHCLYYNERRASQYRYIAAELVWYFMGRNDVDFIKDYSKFWTKIQNDDGTINSAYGHLIFSQQNEHGINQYQWALKCLIDDRDSRQAILHFNQPLHQYFGNKDFVCTVYVAFHIRDNRLNMTVHMRSNDAILGLPTDFAFFSVLQSQMLQHLHRYYPELSIGTYTHIANSMHIYQHHFDLVNEMLARPFTPEKMPQVSDHNLIWENGQPTHLFRDLVFDQVKELKEMPTDRLFSWILSSLHNDK